jgi:type I restriction enzyme S subunit
MSDLTTVPVGELVVPVKTWTPERDAPGEAFTYIDLSAVDQHTKQIVGARRILGGEAPSRARQIVAAGDVLVSTVRPNLNGVALVPPGIDQATASTGFCVLRPRHDKLDGTYLFHWVRSPQFVAEMVRKATGASYPAVSDRIVLESRLPLPSLLEQRRIAGVLDQAEALQAKRRAALSQLDVLTQAIFVDMFGDPATNPRGWPVLFLEEVAATTSGGTPSRDEAGYFGGPIPWVKSGELHQGVIVETEESLTQRGIAESSAKVMPIGTVLVAMYGATVGAVAVLGIEAARTRWKRQ